MQKYDLDALIEFNDKRFFPKVLMNEPGYRMVLLSMRAGQCIPEHATQGIVTVHAILGHITFYTPSLPCELYAGEVVCIEGGIPHRIEAHEDSSLLVLATGGPGSLEADPTDLDLREVPRPNRHPLVFERFDALPVGRSFTIINDHNPIPLNRQRKHAAGTSGLGVHQTWSGHISHTNSPSRTFYSVGRAARRSVAGDSPSVTVATFM
jgi:quercetin dioxygenase-like cupin family protein